MVVLCNYTYVNSVKVFEAVSYCEPVFKIVYLRKDSIRNKKTNVIGQGNTTLIAKRHSGIELVYKSNKRQPIVTLHWFFRVSNSYCISKEIPRVRDENVKLWIKHNIDWCNCDKRISKDLGYIVIKHNKDQIWRIDRHILGS